MTTHPAHWTAALEPNIKRELVLGMLGAVEARFLEAAAEAMKMAAELRRMREAEEARPVEQDRG